DLRSNSRQIVGKIRRREVQLYSNHSAADVNSNRRRNDRGLGGNDTADGCALAQMNVGHDRNVAGDYGKTSYVADLVCRFPLDGQTSGPGLYVLNIQLSHEFAHKHSSPFQVGVARFELATPCSQGRCADQLRYTPMAVGTGFDPVHPLLNGEATSQLAQP